MVCTLLKSLKRMLLFLQINVNAMKNAFKRVTLNLDFE